MSGLVRLYPPSWRARYGDELEALVANRPLGFGGALDLARGALDAHLHPELVDPLADPAAGGPPVSPERFEDLRVARRFGRAAWLGAALWIAGWVIAANGPIVRDAGGSYRDGAAGAPFVLVALALLSAGLLGQLVRLPHASRAPRVGALVAIVAAPLWGLAPWVMWLGIVALAGLVVVAIGTWHAGQWGRLAALTMLGSALGGTAIISWALTAYGGDRLSVLNPMLAAVVVFTPIWLVAGATLQALPPVDPGDDGIDALSGRATAA